MKKLPRHKFLKIKNYILERVEDWISDDKEVVSFDIQLGASKYVIDIFFDKEVKKVYEGSALDHRNLPYSIVEYNTRFIIADENDIVINKYLKGDDVEWIYEFTFEQVWELNQKLKEIWY